MVIVSRRNFRHLSINVHFGTTMYIAGENPKRINKEFYDHLKGEGRDEKTA
jgi:hypothetical protein